MSDDNPWRTFLARRAQGVREVHIPTIITEAQWREGWERAVDHLEREMRRLKAIEAAASSTDDPTRTDQSAGSTPLPGSRANPDPD